MDNLSIVGILVDNRTNIAPKVQEVLTNNGDHIIARFGTHDPGEKNFGLITLHMLSSLDAVDKLANELNELNGVTAKTMTIK